MGQDRMAEAVSETIRAERAARRLSQAELARKAGIPRATYVRYETGERTPNMAVGFRIAQAMGIPLDVFSRRIEERAAEMKE